MAERVVFHVDANSAFLSWSAAYRVKVLGKASTCGRSHRW